MWLTEAKERLENKAQKKARTRTFSNIGILWPELPSWSGAHRPTAHPHLLGLSFALFKSQILRKEAVCPSLGHMIPPGSDKARHLTLHIETEIRVLYQRRRRNEPSNHLYPSFRSQLSGNLSPASVG